MTIHTHHSDRKLHMELTLRPVDLATVRRITRSQLHGWGMATTADDILTVVNELLTNVLDHVPSKRCTLTLEHKAYLLHVRIRDDCPGMPVRQRPRASRTTGRRLALVDTLTHGGWKVVRPPDDVGKEIHCLFDVSPAALPTGTVKGGDIVREIFRYGLTHPDRLPQVVRHTRRACDHLATGESCTPWCLAISIGAVVRDGDMACVLEGTLTQEDSSPAAAARRIITRGTGLRLDAGPATAPPLLIEPRPAGASDCTSPRDRLHFWYLFETPPGSPKPSKSNGPWTPVTDLPPTPLQALFPTSTPGRC
ncbi:ATP-binding protein [Streptomyces sp. NPDC049577]|uniref:ATP-binding protein n=1 Tax=Streptomyces sp. NPDC049577 TaxID=3155153 RepID=UPI00342E04FD